MGIYLIEQKQYNFVVMTFFPIFENLYIHVYKS